MNRDCLSNYIVINVVSAGYIIGITILLVLFHSKTNNEALNSKAEGTNPFFKLVYIENKDPTKANGNIERVFFYIKKS